MKLSSAIILTVCLVGCACAVKWTKYIKIPAFDDRMCPADYVGFQTDARSKASCAVRCNGSPGCRGVIYLHDNGTCYLITADNAFDTSTTLTGAVFFKAILDCPNVTAVTHGRVQGGEFSVGSTVAASCDPGYILNGPEQRTCEPAGTWSDGIPECLEDPGCLDPMVGLSAAHGVADSQLSASSYWCDEVHGLHGYYPEAPDCLAPRYARLNATGWHTGAWAPYYVPNNTEWIQVNFNEPRVISAIVLKGRDPVVGVGDNYVTGFEVSISSDCNFWTTLADETGSPVVFPGTTGPDVTVQDHLTERVVASCMRIHPVTWYGLICLRFDVLGCLPVVTLEGMRLWFVTRAVTHDEAQSACSSVGALVMLDTASKMDALRAYLLDTNNGYRHTNFWVQGRYDVTDDAWEYNDGTPLLEGYWGPDQPVSGGSAYCVQLWASADFAFDDYRPRSSGQFGIHRLSEDGVRWRGCLADLGTAGEFVCTTGLGDSTFQRDDSNLSNGLITSVINKITDAIKAQFPTTPVYATLGNHDYFPSYQFPPHNNWLYNWTLEKWEDWIGDPSQHDNFRRGAYYTVKTQRGLRIVALNTYLYSTSNNATFNVTDPADQLHWLNKTLHDAETNQEKVLVTGHTSPGVHAPGGIVWMREVHHTKLVHILRRYADVIVSMHFGHAHTDTFKILDNGRGDPAGVPIFIAPSVTPNRHLAPDVTLPPHHPGMHIFRYNRTTGTPLSLAQFWFNMDKANNRSSDDRTWGIAYLSHSLFAPNLPNLTASTLIGLVGHYTEMPWEFKDYWNRFTVYPPDTSFDRKSCNAECRAEVLCGFTHLDYDEWLQCKHTEYSSASSLKLDIVLTAICTLLLVFSRN